mgnify:CR=1 FL=1
MKANRLAGAFLAMGLGLVAMTHAGEVLADKKPKKEAEVAPANEPPTTKKPVALPLAGIPAWALAQQFPTAKVNTTKLAVTDTEVTVGQLHSATGTMAISETGSIQAEQLAIDQINAMGGILGRKIKVIKEDGASDWPTFAEKAKKLKAEGRDIISFSIGVPNFLPGEHVYAAAREALAKDSGSYGSNRGPDALLEAFLKHLRAGGEGHCCVVHERVVQDLGG